MATSTNISSATKEAKAPSAEIPLAKRLDTQITKAVFAGKLSVEELKVLVDRLTRLHAFVSV